MPMRNMVSAPAIRGSATPAIASINSRRREPAFSRIFQSASQQFLLDFDDYFLCNLMQRLCQWREFACQMPLGRSQLLVTRMPRYKRRCLFWHQPCKLTPRSELRSCRIFVQRSLVHARPKFDLVCGPGSHPRLGPAGRSGASRDRGALRHFDGGYSADHGPAGSRRRRLSVHRLHDLRSAGRLGNGCVGPARQAGAGARHRMEGRRQGQDQVALYACARASNSTTAAISMPTR